MNVHVSDLEEWLKIIANEQSEYHLPGTLLTLLRAIRPYESGMFANFHNNVMRPSTWTGKNPALLRKCFSKLKKENFFEKSFDEIHEIELNKKYFYFIPLKNKNKLLSLAALEYDQQLKGNDQDVISVLANQTAISIDRNKLEEWASMTDCIIYILEPIFAAKTFDTLIRNIQKGSMTLLGADSSALYFDGIEKYFNFEENHIESILAKHVHETRKAWVGTVGQFFDEFPEHRNTAYVPEQMRSILAVPVFNEQEYIGGITTSYFYTDIPFEAQDRKLFEIYANKLFRAITNRTQYIQMEESNKQLEELDEVKEKAMHQVTHDLKTPLGAIKGFTELMLMVEQDKRSQKLYLENILAASGTLLTMIQDLLDLAKLKSTGEFQLKDFEATNLGSLIQDLCKTAAGISNKHEVICTIDDGIPKVNIDQKAISRVVSNFVSNAIKYSPRGGDINVHAQIIKDEETSMDFAQVSIKDQGLGIPEDKLEGLFDSFTRVDTKEHKKIDGTGLGLAICKEIVVAHHGKVWVESEAKVGSTFYFAIPI